MMEIIDEKLLTDVFGLAGATVQSPASPLEQDRDVMPVKEKKNNQSPIKKSPELFSYRHKIYKNFKEALRASGFTPFTADKFGRGEDDYKGKEEEILDYLRELYIKMYGKVEREYHRIELEKALKRIEELWEYV